MEAEQNGFGQELRRRRQAAGKSLGELAERVPCSRSFLSRVENGMRRPTYELAERCDHFLEAGGELLSLAPRPRPAREPRGGKERDGVRGPVRTASKLVDRAAPVPPDAPALASGYGEEFDRLVRRGDLRHAAGRMREADRCYREAHRLAEGRPRAQALAVVRICRRWSDPGQVDRELLHLIGDSLAALRDDPGPEAGALRLQLNAHRAKKLSMAVSADTAVPQAGPDSGAALARHTLGGLERADAADAAEASGVGEEVRCEVLTECRWGLYDFAPAAASLALSERLRDAAVRHGSAHFRGEALMGLAVDQLRMGRVYPALSTAQEHRRHAAASRSELARWQQRTLDTTLDLWRGRFAAAADWILRESAEYADRLAADLDVPAGNFRQTRMGQAYWLLREQGRMHELFAGGLADDVQEHGYFPVWRAGLVLALCETGARDQAADLLQAFADDTDGFRALPPHGWAVPTLALLAEACAAIGDQAELRPLVARLRERLAPHNGTGIALAGWPTVLVAPTAQACGVLALTAGEPDAALAHFRLAATPARTSAPQLARLRLWQARALRACGRPDAAAEAPRLLRSARAVAEEYGMARLAAECAAPPEEAGGG
ncbi:helix-turn-helix transcriptional regulator [Streptomyces sp. PA03-1a]|nr:helix-turn-helix transcriptional regulator [Streptomyces sp. PA03-1a]MDX2811628.1 helix-turn-helix transcriptional regulator [Streptomyces sp. PA03-5A]